MNKLIDDLIEKGMGNFMDRSRDALAWADEIYMNDMTSKMKMNLHSAMITLT